MAWTDDYISANGIRLHCTRTGGDKPPIVLLHGLSDNGVYWTTIAQDLEHDYELIMPDARGHGLSEPVSANPTWTDNAEDIASLIQQLGLKTPAVIGHSMGAATAGVLASRHPELVGCLVLEDPPLFERNVDPQAPSSRVAFGPWEQSLVVLKSLPRSEQLAAARKEHPNWPDIENERWVDTKIQFDLTTFKAAAAPAPNWRDTLSKIQCPTLLLTGDIEKGALITPQVAQEFVSLLPNARLVKIAGAGHSIRYDQHDAYLRAVIGFLGEHYSPRKQG